MDDAKASEVAILNKSLYRKVEKPKNIQVGFVEDIIHMQPTDYNSMYVSFLLCFSSCLSPQLSQTPTSSQQIWLTVRVPRCDFTGGVML